MAQNYADMTATGTKELTQQVNEDNDTELYADKADKSNVLELDNTISFTPDADHEPATKKYVDDNVLSGGDVISVANGTATLGTTEIASGASATVVTVAATGVLATDTIVCGFNSDPTAVTGYAPSTDGMLTIISYPTVDNVNFKVCNNLASAVTPGSITLNWRVSR